MDSHAIAALLRLQKPLALYQQQREAADAALRLAIEEAGFDPGVLEASVLDVPPMPLPGWTLSQIERDPDDYVVRYAEEAKQMTWPSYNPRPDVVE
jgi:8-oxo-dGTP pyrophosphatase MutT (NUDIX family)